MDRISGSKDLWKCSVSGGEGAWKNRAHKGEELAALQAVLKRDPELMLFLSAPSIPGNGETNGNSRFV